MKIAVVTGASSGIGREFALQISRKYGKLDEIWLIARRKDLMQDLEKHLRVPVRIFAMDLTDDGDMNQFKEYLEELRPDIKLLVNSAGMGKIGRIDSQDVIDQADMVDLNCRALTIFTGLCLPYISTHSRIINMASAAAFSPQPNFAVYAATKAYVLSYSRALNVELKERKITVTTVCPGPVDTEFFVVAGDSEGKSFKKNLRVPADKVVTQAIKDAALGNELSIYGTIMKMAKGATKVLPQKAIMSIFK